ncbi:MAG: carboxypeptidase-like regulatory domain-containing protein [Chloroflexota bacterium]|nr:carboxypeptidase-like regulatory domain-containing protein [Chloroflexota bacterium]
MKCTPVVGQRGLEEVEFEGFGFYMFDLQPGEYILSATAPGYSVTSVPLTVTAGDDIELDLALEPAP